MTVNIGPGIAATPALRDCLVHAGDLAAAGGAQVVYDAATGCPHLVQHILEFGPERCAPRTPGACDEVLFVLSGHGLLHLGGEAHVLDPEAGATILPANPGFYHRPGNVEQVVDFIVARILDHLGVAHELMQPWGG